MPRVILFSKEKMRVKPEHQNSDWNEYIDERRARYRREMEQLYQMFSNWVFMQSTVYRKNMDSIEKAVGKEKSINIRLGIEK